MRISDWSSDVCSSDLEWQRRWCRNDGLHPPRNRVAVRTRAALKPAAQWMQPTAAENQWRHSAPLHRRTEPSSPSTRRQDGPYPDLSAPGSASGAAARSEEHTSELQSLMRISYAVFCLKKKNTIKCLK